MLTSNPFAILGLRAMYFLLAGVAERFSMLKYGLAVILVFIGIKMLIVDFYHIPPSSRWRGVRHSGDDVYYQTG